ncbi:hypothetical protein HDV00_008194 [Rhizophlyctis rosea]|nr:hypothetical protein HDV00_008194 [Rhizophlyctis rosea]
MTATKMIVIVGGGYGGTKVATELDKFLERLFVPYTNLFQISKSSQVVVGEVKSISTTNVTLADGTTIAFDYLVIATGSAYPSPFKISTSTTQEGMDKLLAIDLHIKKSSHIVIIGGGLVGCELAGEIAVEYPDKKVTIIQAAKTLAPGPSSTKLKTKLQQGLKSRGVEVILNEGVMKLDTLFPNPTEKGHITGPTTLTTSSNRTVEADLVFLATGNHTFNSTAAESLGTNIVDQNSQITVTRTLQLPSHPNIFALGDVCSASEGIKFSFFAELQGQLVAGNIKRLILASEPAAVQLKEWQPGMMMEFVTLGRTRGSSQMGVVWGDWFTKLVKGGDMFAKRRWADLGSLKDYKW